MNIIAWVIIALIMMPNVTLAAKVECSQLRWKLTETGRPGIYRGTVKPGSVDIIHIVMSNRKGVYGQAMGFPNPAGHWQIKVYGDYHVKKRHTERFYCEKF